MAPERDAILSALERVIDPELHKPVTELDMVRDVVVHGDGAVEVTIALTVAGCPMRVVVRGPGAAHVGAVAGVASVRAPLRRDEPGREGGAVHAPPRRPAGEDDLARADHARARDRVGQGRRRQVDADGEPGRSAPARRRAVGVLDADVYGHSIPHMLGVHQRPVVVDR